MTPPLHHSGYQNRDRLVVDYHEYPFTDDEILFRGPEPEGLDDGEFITCFGAAQTFGCFTDRPFPEQLRRRTGRGVRNLGYGGAGPRFYNEHPALITEANRGALAVVQVMSARSEDNSLFRSGGLEYLTDRRNGARVGANAAYASVLGGYRLGAEPPTNRYVKKIRRTLAARRAASLVAETRDNWIASTVALLDALTVPTILLWFSVREPGTGADNLRSVHTLFREYPQMVNQSMVDAVRPHADAFVDVTTDVGLPQPLFHIDTGEPVTVNPNNDRADLGDDDWTHNRYYPSPEMHDAAADAVATAVTALLP